MGRLLASCLLITALAGAESEPLSGQGAQAAAIHHALQALTRGDTAPLAALPAATFHAPIGIGDPADAGLLRRWTVFLPQAIARVPAAERAAVLQALDALFFATAGSDRTQREYSAGDFLPAPGAIATLRQEADRHFDRGRLTAFLGCVADLERLAVRDPSLEARRNAARSLLGMGAETGPAPPRLCLPPFPEELPPGPSTSTADANGATLRWRRLGMWLAAIDHQGMVRWQRALDRQAEMTCGPGGAVVREAGSTRFIDETGRIVLVAPIPQEARILGVSGGCAWLAMGIHAWRVGFDGGVQVLALDAEPLGPPLPRGARTLWLDAHRLTLRDGRQVVDSALHGLPATRGWRLRADPGDGTIAICASDGRRWELTPSDALISRAAGAEERAFLLATTGQSAAAQALLATTPPAAEAPRRRQRLQAELALGWDHVAAHWRELAADGDEAQMRATVLSAGLPDSADALRTWAAAHPRITLPGDGPQRDRPLWSPATWDQRRSGEAWLDATGHDPASTHDDGVRRDRDGSIVHRGARFAVQRRDGWMEATAHHAVAEAFLWYQRWPALGDCAAPGLTLSARSSQILVMEGDSRLSVLAASDGTLIARVALPDGASMWSDALAPAPGMVALVGPAGVDRQAWILGLREPCRVDLPAAARRLRVVAGRAAVELADDRVLWLPELTPTSSGVP